MENQNENDVDFERRKLEIKRKMARTKQELTDKMVETKKNIQANGKEKIFLTIGQIQDGIKSLGCSMNTSMKRIEEKSLEKAIKKTENCEMYIPDAQKILLVNEELMKENNFVTYYAGKYGTYSIKPNTVMLDLYYFLQSDEDILSFADIVEEETGMSKTGKMLMILIMSYIYHCCNVDQYTIWEIASFSREYNNFDRIFENVQKHNADSFLAKMLNNFQLQNDDEKRRASIEVADFFAIGDLHHEKIEVVANWLFECSHMLIRYIYESDDENKIILVKTKDNKYGNIVYRFLKHVLDKEERMLATGSEKIKERENIVRDIAEYRPKKKNNEYFFKKDPFFATTEDTVDEYEYFDTEGEI